MGWIPVLGALIPGVVALILLWRVVAERRYSQALEDELARFRVAKASDEAEIVRLKRCAQTLEDQLGSLKIAKASGEAEIAGLRRSLAALERGGLAGQGGTPHEP